MKDDQGERETVDHDGVKARIDVGTEVTVEVGLEVVEHGAGGELEGVGKGTDDEEEDGVEEAGTLLGDSVEDGRGVGTAGIVLEEKRLRGAGGTGEEGVVEGGVGEGDDLGGPV